MALATVPRGAVTKELAIRRAETVAAGDDPQLQQIAPDDEAGIAAGAKGGDLVVAVALLVDGLFQNSSSSVVTSLVLSAVS